MNIWGEKTLKLKGQFMKSKCNTIAASENENEKILEGRLSKTRVEIN